MGDAAGIDETSDEIAGGAKDADEAAEDADGTSGTTGDDAGGTETEPDVVEIAAGPGEDTDEAEADVDGIAGTAEEDTEAAEVEEDVDKMLEGAEAEEEVDSADNGSGGSSVWSVGAADEGPAVEAKEIGRFGPRVVTGFGFSALGLAADLLFFGAGSGAGGAVADLLFPTTNPCSLLSALVTLSSRSSSMSDSSLMGALFVMYVVRQPGNISVAMRCDL
jgi:hypothetical protein